MKNSLELLNSFGVKALVLAMIQVAIFSNDVTASWVSEITGVHVDVPSMTLRLDRPRPEKIPDMIQHLPRDAANFFLNPVAPHLAFLIRQARAQALRSARPIPVDIKRALIAFFPPSIIDKAKYTTRSQAGISLATAVLEGNGNISAITLGEVIVFDDNQGTSDPVLWAHELVHVSQYENMGIDGFAAMYAGPGSNTLEGDAESWENHVASQINPSQDSSSIASQWIDTRGATSPANITWSNFNQAARAVIPPHQCAQWGQTDPFHLMVTNICPVPIAITGVNNNGMFVPCAGPACLYPPNSQHPLRRDIPVNIIGVWFEFR